MLAAETVTNDVTIAVMAQKMMANIDEELKEIKTTFDEGKELKLYSTKAKTATTAAPLLTDDTIEDIVKQLDKYRQ